MQELQLVEPTEHHATSDAYAIARVEHGNVLVCIVTDIGVTTAVERGGGTESETGRSTDTL